MANICPHCRTEYPPDVVVCPNDGARLSTDRGDAHDATIGSILADRYRVIRVLGEGGMGRVYLAEHVRMGRLSAVKVMSPALAPTSDAISRFNREASNASRINHPNVAAIYDFGETADGTLYLAMEYVEGETLGALLRRVGPLSPMHAADLTRQIADALNAAHQLGIVHRDLKPDNILIARDAEGRDVVKVVDFGIAKSVQAGGGQTVTTAGMSIGTPEYMSPEQLAGQTLDSRTDIYSLGLVTFKMLTGVTAYPDVTSKQSLVQRLTSRPRPLAEAKPDVAWPPRLQPALDRALSPEPEDRYRKATEFALDVTAATGVAQAMAELRTRAMTPLGVSAIPETVIAATASKPAAAPAVSAANPVSRRPLFAVGGAIAAAALVFVVWRSMTDTPTSSVGTLASAPPSDTVKPLPAAQPPAPRDSASSPTTQQPIAGYLPSPDAGFSGVVKRPAPPIRGADSDRSGGALSKPAVRDTTPASARAVASNSLARPKVDSTPVTAPVSDPSAAALPPRNGAFTPEAREIMNHVDLARQSFALKEIGKAGMELRSAHEKLVAFARTHPGSRETFMLRQQVLALTTAALASCEAARDSMPMNRRNVKMCDGLARSAGGLANAAPPGPGQFPGQRRNRQPLRP